MKTTNYVVARLNNGFVVRPVEPLDNSRWYFDSKIRALEHVQCLEREIFLDGQNKLKG